MKGNQKIVLLAILSIDVYVYNHEYNDMETDLHGSSHEINSQPNT